MKAWIALSLALLATSAAAAPAEPACETLTPALVGGPVPGARSDTAVIRWLGTSNYEVAWKGKVFLFDTYYERPGRTRSIGFTVDQVKRADVIFIGHAHSDHISDVAPVAKQTGAIVVGAPVTIETAIRMGVPEAQTRVVRGGETLEIAGVKVETALVRHSTIQDGLFDAYGRLYAVDGLAPLTDAEQAQARQVAGRGATNREEVTERGVIAYGLVLPSGFSVVAVDTAGPPTDQARALAAKLGRPDVAMIAYTPHAVAERQVRDTWPLIELFRPKLFLPSHHDHIWGSWLDLGVEPLFQKIRDEKPEIAFAAPLYRSAICIGTAGRARGELKIKYSRPGSITQSSRLWR